MTIPLELRLRIIKISREENGDFPNTRDRLSDYRDYKLPSEPTIAKIMKDEGRYVPRKQGGKRDPGILGINSYSAAGTQKRVGRKPKKDKYSWSGL